MNSDSVVADREATKATEASSNASPRRLLNPDYKEYWLELIKLSPQLGWLVIGVVAFSWFYSPIKSYLERNPISKVGVGVLQIEFAAKQIIEAAKKRNQDVPPELTDRIERSSSKLLDTAILWVDDNPSRNLRERRALSSLGITIDVSASSKDALKSIEHATYDIVISDFHRGETDSASCLHEDAAGAYPPSNAGCYLLHEIRKRYRDARKMPPIIFYSGMVDPAWGAPAYSFGATDRVGELFHLVLDALERRKAR